MEGSKDVGNALSLSGELFHSIKNAFDLGVGVTWQFSRSRKNSESDFYFIPVYGMFRWRSPSEKVAPYAIGQLGYNFFFGDSKHEGSGWFDGGLYYGIGGGIILNNHFEIEALYSVNKGSYDFLRFVDIEYSKISIIFGYIF